MFWHSGASKSRQPPPPGLKPQCASRAPTTHSTPCYRENTDPTLLFTSADSPKAGPLLKCCDIFNIYWSRAKWWRNASVGDLVKKSEEQLSCSSSYKSWVRCWCWGDLLPRLLSRFSRMRGVTTPHFFPQSFLNSSRLRVSVVRADWPGPSSNPRVTSSSWWCQQHGIKTQPLSFFPPWMVFTDAPYLSSNMLLSYFCLHKLL